MGWVKGSDRNFEASHTERCQKRYRKTKKDRRERRETSGGGPKIRVRGRGSSTCAPGSGPRIVYAKNLRKTFLYFRFDFDSVFGGRESLERI